MALRLKCTMIACLLIVGQVGFAKHDFDHHLVLKSPQKVLLNSLLESYGEPSLRPVINQSDPVIMHLTVSFKRMVAFEQNDQQLTVIVNIQMDWRDEYLIWNSTEHNGVDRLFIPFEKIWKFDLTLYSSVSKSMVELDHKALYVKPDGMVKWLSSAVLHSSCLVRVRYFPFDKQYCRIILASWTYDNTSVTLFESHEKVRTEFFINNGVWDLVSIEKEYQTHEWDCCDNTWGEVHFLLLFQRQSRYYVINVIVPSTILSLVSLLVFFMPPDSSEKVTLASSNLLAMLLFQELVSTSMPPIGTQFPLIGTFFVASIVVNTLSIFSSIFIMYLHNKDDRPVPSWIKRLTIIKADPNHEQSPDTPTNSIERRLSKLICTNTISKAVHLRYRQENGQNVSSVGSIRSKYLELSSIPGGTDAAEEVKERCDPQCDGKNTATLESKDQIVADWQEVALKVNRVMGFLLTCSIVVTALIIIFLYIVQEEGEFPKRT